MSLPRINFQDLEDLNTRKNFENLMAFLRRETPLLGFRLFEVTFTAAEANRKVPHSLGFQPVDILQTSLIGTGGVTFNYGLFDSTNLNLTATGPCVVRFFAGTYQAGAT